MEFAIGALALISLISINEREFFDTAVEQQQEDFKWMQLEKCRAPTLGIPSLPIETPIGNQFVCFKLEK
tara:strand:- start:2318 stop:2524 length:207 start_codon:yes stop_codon:yes gene_type:complete